MVQQTNQKWKEKKMSFWSQIVSKMKTGIKKQELKYGKLKSILYFTAPLERKLNAGTVLMRNNILCFSAHFR